MGTTIRPGNVQTESVNSPCGQPAGYASARDGADGTPKEQGSHDRRVLPVSTPSSNPPVLEFDPSSAHHHDEQGRDGV